VRWLFGFDHFGPLDIMQFVMKNVNVHVNVDDEQAKGWMRLSRPV